MKIKLENNLHKRDSKKDKILHQPRATGEVAYSELTPLSEASDSTIFSVVDSASNFKLDIQAIRAYVLGNATKYINWTETNGDVLNLLAEDLTGFSKLIITMEDLPSAGNTLTVLIPQEAGNDFEIDFEIRYDAFTPSNPTKLVIQKVADILIEFILPHSGIDDLVSRMYVRKTSFAISQTQILRPKGIFAYKLGEGTGGLVGGLLPDRQYLQNDLYRFTAVFKAVFSNRSDYKSSPPNEFEVAFDAGLFMLWQPGVLDILGANFTFAPDSTLLQGYIRNYNSQDARVLGIKSITAADPEGNSVNYVNYRQFQEYTGTSSDRQLLLTKNDSSNNSDDFKAIILYDGQGI